MKKYFIALALFASSFFAINAKAQATVTLPGASAYQVKLAWTLSSDCTTTTTCNVIPYRIGGTCPATLAGTGGWTQLSTTAPQAIASLDGTVTAGQTYSYVVEEVFTTGSSNGNPSNCVTIVIPNVPGTPTNLTAK